MINIYDQLCIRVALLKTITSILFLSIVAFTNVFKILEYNTDEVFTGDNFLYGMLYTYRTALGDFNTDYVSNSDKNFYIFDMF